MIALRTTVFVAIAVIVLGAARGFASIAAPRPQAPLQLVRVPTAAVASAQANDRARFFEARVQSDAGDIDILNQLAVLYLERLRETGSFADLDLAMRASQRSLAIVPAARNTIGLTARAMAEFSSHEFTAARSDARTLLHYDGSGRAYALLGDAEAELGNYQAAAVAYALLGRSVASDDQNLATRQARMAQLRGDSRGMRDALERALEAELKRGSPVRERVSWYCWQLGDNEFFSGDYAGARTRYGDALSIYPGYFRALASLGRLEAALGDYPRAIAEYDAAIVALPDPTFVAERGDVYALAGKNAEAERDYALVDAIGRLSASNGVRYNRQLAMFDADHDRNASGAYRAAAREYRTRRDILGADTLAWTALKAGKIREARAAIRAALRFGSNDPRLLFHAGMIALASAQPQAARRLLETALHLSPGFEPLQAVVARRALVEIARR